MTEILNKITHVAIKYAGKVYFLPSPNRHHHVIRMIAKENGVGVQGSDTQGFLDSKGTFINRMDAYNLATANGQIKPDPKQHPGKALYSEDLW